MKHFFFSFFPTKTCHVEFEKRLNLVKINFSIWQLDVSVFVNYFVGNNVAFFQSSSFSFEMPLAFQKIQHECWFFPGLGLCRNNWLHLCFTLFFGIQCAANRNKSTVSKTLRILNFASFHIAIIIHCNLAYFPSIILIGSYNIVLTCGANLHFSIIIIFLCRISHFALLFSLSFFRSSFPPSTSFTPTPNGFATKQCKHSNKLKSQTNIKLYNRAKKAYRDWESLNCRRKR